MTFLSKDDADSVINLVNLYPQFLPLYKEIADFRKSPKEMIGMFSEALAIMDRNTERLMVDEWREEAEAYKKEAEAYKQDAEAYKTELDESKEKLAASEEKLESRNKKIMELEARIRELTK